MNDDVKELIDALKMKIEAMQIKNDALRLRLEALEMLNQYGGMRATAPITSYMPMPSAAPAPAREVAEMEEAESDSDEAGKKRGRKPKVSAGELKKMQGPLDNLLHDLLKDENFNRATYRAITGILLCLYENGSATVSLLHEYIGGSRVTIVRHTGLLKRLNLLVYVGSRKKGHYELTDKGKELLNDIRSQVA